jgi:hypothetical protein
MRRVVARREVLIRQQRDLGRQRSRRHSRERGGAEEPWDADRGGHQASDRLLRGVARCPPTRRNFGSVMLALAPQ